MVEESKYCSHVLKKYFNKELVMTKEDAESFEISIKCWVCDYNFVEGDVKVRDHCHITEKYRGDAHRFLYQRYSELQNSHRVSQSKKL